MRTLKTKKVDDIELDEQQLCQKCGLCCNGTLFGFVRLVDNDRLHMKSLFSVSFTRDNKSTFKQPCRYYRDKSCGIYNSRRPHSCSIFLCKLLIRHRQKKISSAEAVNLIEVAVAQAEQLRKKFSIAVFDYEKALPKLFNEYVASHTNPDQTLMLEYGILQCRLKS